MMCSEFQIISYQKNSLFLYFSIKYKVKKNKTKAMATGIPSKLFYKEAMEQVHIYNSRLLRDRRLRMPYIDSQTGLIQQECHLWVSRVQRSSPIRQGQVYSYPAQRWRVRKRPDFIGAKAKAKLAEKTKIEEESLGIIQSHV